MKLFELTGYSEEEKTAALSAIKQDCQSYLKEVGALDKNNQLWRGFSGSTGRGIQKITAKANRLPLHTPKKLHDALNEFFVEKFGWPARNGTFATFNMLDAASYGDLFAVFPIGEFKYVWSPDVEDMYNQLEDVIEDIDGARTIEEAISDIKKLTWKDDDIHQMRVSPTTSKHEMAFNSKEYYLMKKSLVNVIDWNKI